LLYYGVLSLSRGVILLRDRTKSEASLKPSHGLEVVHWKETLAGGISEVLDLKVRATNGTFSELAAAVDNLQLTGWWCAPKLNLGQYHVSLPAPRFLVDKSEITFEDLASRDQRLLGLYERATGKASRVHLGEIVADTSGLEVSIFAFSNGASKAVVESRFGWPSGTVVRERAWGRRMPIPNYYVQIPGSDLNALKPLLPVTHYDGGDGMYVVEDFPNGDRLSELLRTFLLSYFLGMLVRYFPSRWMALLRNEKGDAAQPVLIAAVNAIEGDFPKLILSAAQ
jgi:hypothetical protein